MGTLRIGKQDIKYEVKTRDKINYVELRFRPGLNLEVVIPEGMDAEKVLQKKRLWIKKKFNQLQEQIPISDGKRLLYKGQYHDLQCVPIDSNVEKVEVQDGKISVQAQNLIEAQKRIQEWMSKETEKLTSKKAKHFADHLDVNLGELNIRHTKRWGYCSSTGKLVFNWQLIALPEELANFVVLHEVAHLVNFNHSRSFYARLASLCPNYKEYRRELKKYQTGQIKLNDSF